MCTGSNPHSLTCTGTFLHVIKLLYKRKGLGSRSCHVPVTFREEFVEIRKYCKKMWKYLKTQWPKKYVEIMKSSATVFRVNLWNVWTIRGVAWGWAVASAATLTNGYASMQIYGSSRKRNRKWSELSPPQPMRFASSGLRVREGVVSLGHGLKTSTNPNMLNATNLNMTVALKPRRVD